MIYEGNRNIHLLMSLACASGSIRVVEIQKIHKWPVQVQTNKRSKHLSPSTNAMQIYTDALKINEMFAGIMGQMD